MRSHQPDPAILLLHDGELSEFVPILEPLGAFERRGDPTDDDRSITWDLVLGSSKRMLDLHNFLPETVSVRIAVLDGESRSMRTKLREAEMDLLVRRPVHPAALRLLILHCLYRGPEKRRNLRVGVGASVRFRSGWRTHLAILTELSTAGCRLRARPGARPIRSGSNLTLLVPSELNAGRRLSVRGCVARMAPAEARNEDIAVVFENLRPKTRQQLAAIVSDHSHGPAMLDENAALALESNPETRSDESVIPQPSESTPEKPAERRADPRRSLDRSVIALADEAARVLIGRDLSMSGMRVDPTPGIEVGDRLRIALHIGTHGKPLVLSARVARDDGEVGLALQFTDVCEDASRCLDEMLAALPTIAETCERDEGAGVVVTELMGPNVY